MKFLKWIQAAWRTAGSHPPSTTICKTLIRCCGVCWICKHRKVNRYSLCITDDCSLTRVESKSNLIKALLSCFTVVWIGAASSRSYDYRKSRRIHRFRKNSETDSPRNNRCVANFEVVGRLLRWKSKRRESKSKRKTSERERESGLGFYDWSSLVWSGLV